MNEDLVRALGKVEGRMEGMESQLASLTSAINQRLDDDNKRITAVEKRQWMTIGATGLVVFIVPYAAHALGIL